MRNLHDELIGEIVQGRYAVLERTGVDRYRAFDMRELRQLEMLRWDEHWHPLPAAPSGPPAHSGRPAHSTQTTGRPLPSGRPASPPPIPVERPNAPRRRRVTARGHAPMRSAGDEGPAAPMHRGPSQRTLEAAWFAWGLLLEQGEAEAEVTDYHAYQARLEEIAADLEAKPHAADGRSSLSNTARQSILLFAAGELAS